MALLLTSPGSPLFIQRRIGYQCRPFRMLKLRTMEPDAESQEAELARKHGLGRFFKLREDPRTTKLGRLLRRFSIDEIPQLFNVLAGQMSLVGPRPLLLRDFDLYPKQEQLRRFGVLPGLTGLWQVNGRSEVGDDRRLELDLEYVDHWSHALDLKILLRTIPAVLSRRGAH
jgi:lipopolysaccharide/colanic/teichoic acid biosynthesis glycosyltransferase